MDRCDVLIVGGGPAGSSCAGALVRAGLDVLVMDKMAFPRDKVCAGWITPAVIDALALDVDDYRRDHVFQTFSRFRIGLLNGPIIETDHHKPVSFGIRRCEFDDYLLRRSGARLRLGEPVKQLSRSNDGWLVNETIRAPVLIGAGGHFCPVARFLGAHIGTSEPAVMAQEAEFALPAALTPSYGSEEGVPELYFCPDLLGYGWCVRKDGFINIGMGREDNQHLARHVADFLRYLVDNGRIADQPDLHFHGHAYLLYPQSKHKLVDDRVLLIGDAAGLAYARSGEGIRPAVESGLLAAETVLQAQGQYDRDSLSSYRERLRFRLGPGSQADSGLHLPDRLRTLLAGHLLSRPWFVRHIVLDRWFLHSRDTALKLSLPA